MSQKNLLAEGVSEETITVTGNTVIDALHWALARIEDDKLTWVDDFPIVNTFLVKRLKKANN